MNRRKRFCRQDTGGVREEHPDDPRNTEAADRLDQLRSSLPGVDDPTMDAYAALWDDNIDSERHSELLRRAAAEKVPL